MEGEAKVSRLRIYVRIIMKTFFDGKHWTRYWPIRVVVLFVLCFVAAHLLFWKFFFINDPLAKSVVIFILLLLLIQICIMTIFTSRISKAE
jgi:hypothetical protein